MCNDLFLSFFLYHGPKGEEWKGKLEKGEGRNISRGFVWNEMVGARPPF